MHIITKTYKRQQKNEDLRMCVSLNVCIYKHLEGTQTLRHSDRKTDRHLDIIGPIGMSWQKPNTIFIFYILKD